MRHGMTNLQVHHIVPLNGQGRYYSAYNLPWNLIVFCTTCHLLIAAVMRGAAAVRRFDEQRQDVFRLAASAGQGMFAEMVK